MKFIFLFQVLRLILLMKIFNKENLVDGPNGRIEYMSFPVHMNGPNIYGPQNIEIN